MEYEAWKATWKAPLNPQQEAAVQAAQGPVLLLAVPGSGKTTVLIHRLGYLIFCLGVAPEQILTVTYTVAATRDMAARFARTFGETWANRLEFRTINGLSARIIQHYERVKGRQAFTLVTEEGRLAALVGELYRKATGEFAAESTVRSFRTAITYCKNRQMTQEEIEAYQVEDIPFAKLYRQYHAELRRRRWMDYDDQMVYAAQILRQHGDILAYFQDKYRYLCVDEAQDTSRIQHTILKLLAGRRRNLFLVGDEDQSIYGFRAADPGALLRFEEEYPGGRVLFLEKNYRSTATIVAMEFRRHCVEMPPAIASVLLSAVMTDTVILKSPTATYVDHEIVDFLADVAGVDPTAFGLAVFRCRGGEDNMPVAKLVGADSKEFQLGDSTVLIAQHETVDLPAVMKREDEIRAYMRRLREDRGYEFVLLMVTDILAEGSQFLCEGNLRTVNRGFNIDCSAEGGTWMPGVLSRKKQVAAKILGA